MENLKSVTVNAFFSSRSRAALRRFAADNPADSRIVAQALGVVN
jgi:hypothetical protein